MKWWFVLFDITGMFVLFDVCKRDACVCVWHGFSCLMCDRDVVAWDRDVHIV